MRAAHDSLHFTTPLLCWHKLGVLISPSIWNSDDGVSSASAGNPKFCSELFAIISPELPATHNSCVCRALQEWHRVLKPGGHLIVSGAHHSVTTHMPALNLILLR